MTDEIGPKIRNVIVKVMASYRFPDGAIDLDVDGQEKFVNHLKSEIQKMIIEIGPFDPGPFYKYFKLYDLIFETFPYHERTEKLTHKIMKYLDENNPNTKHT